MENSAITLIFFCQLILFVNSHGEFGCYKPSIDAIQCKQESKVFNQNLTKSIAYALQWMRTQKQNLSFPVLSSDVLQSYALNGYINDQAECSTNLNLHKQNILNKVNQGEVVPGGKLAKYLIGLKASCHNNSQIKNLLEVLKQKTNRYPEGEFNNYFQYSLAVLALFSHGNIVPSKYGQKILENMVTSERNQNKTYRMDDTEALSILALTAIVKQKSTFSVLRMKIEKELKKKQKKVRKILKNDGDDNLITLSLILQVASTTQESLADSSYCRSILEKFLKIQKADGSFGSLQETSFIVKSLSGKSLLDIKNVQCPFSEDKVDSTQFQKFIQEYEHIKGSIPATAKPSSKDTITVKLMVANTVNGVKILAEQDFTVPATSTALEVLKYGSQFHKCFKHETKTSSWGEYITRICGIDQDHESKAYWMYYVNDKLPNIGSDSYQVKDGDVIKYSYELYKPH